MSWPIVSTRYAPDAPVSTDLFGDIIKELALASANGSSQPFVYGSPFLSNGSFEIDPPGTVNPNITSWYFTGTNATASVVGLNSYTGATHGTQSLAVVLATGAGTATGNVYFGTNSSQSKIPISDLQTYALNIDYFTTTANATLTVQCGWFTASGAAGTPNSSCTIYAYATNGWTSNQVLLVPPSGASQMTLLIQIVDSVSEGNQTFYLDDLYIQVKPANTSYAYSTNNSTPSQVNGIQQYQFSIGTNYPNLSWVVPAGVRSVDIEMWAANLYSAAPTKTGINPYGGAILGRMQTIPGTTIYFNADQYGTLSFTYSFNNQNYNAICYAAYNPTLAKGLWGNAENNEGGNVPTVNLLQCPNSSSFSNGTIIFRY